MTNQSVTVHVHKKLSAFRWIIVLKWAMLVLICFVQVQASSQQMLWGVAMEGGESGVGTIFKTNADGTGLEVKKSFEAIPGRSPSYTPLIQASNGKIYGMTGWGGPLLKGVLFEYNPIDGSYVKKYDFNGIDGANPVGGLVEVNNKLYGLTPNGGVNGRGVLFSYDPIANKYEKKLDFGGLAGESPNANLVSTSDGILYGVTYGGGANGYGVLFRYDSKKNTFTKKKDFDGSAGRNPNGALLIASSGTLYGMATQGGLNSRGTIYSYDTTTNIITKKIDFAGSSNGGRPTGKLIQATNGLLYGMTSEGGSLDRGVLFEFNPADGTITKRVDFDATKGHSPYGSLFEASDGKLYGVTEIGGLFRFDISSGNYSQVVKFDGTPKGTGGFSRTTLMQASDGKLYGMNSVGGLANYGTLFSFDPTNTDFQVKISFEFDEEAGTRPRGSLVQAANGKLYGTTSDGGAYSAGTLFEIDVTKGTYTKKFDFGLSGDTGPYTNMILATNGKLYGVTRFGGSSETGVIFEYDPALNLYAKKLDFPSSYGRLEGALIQIPTGKMYGVGFDPNTFGTAILFEFDPTSNSLVKKADFNKTNHGNWPSGSLLYVEEKLFGLMKSGGANDKGTLFEYNLATGTLTKLKDFDGTNDGSSPIGNLIKAENNKLYGVTESGGSINAGTIFEYDPVGGTFTKKFDFTERPANFSDVQSGFVESSNGKLYGATFEGGTNDFGALYEFDVESNTYTKKHDFKGFDGASIRSALIFISMEEQTVTFSPIEERTSGDPFTLTATASSGLPVTFSSSNPAVATVNGNTVTVHGPGTTTITATQAGSPNFHSASAEQIVTVNYVLSTDDPYSSQLKLYPNPSRMEFFIDVGGSKQYNANNLLVYDYLGRASSIPLEKLGNGKYKCTTTQLAPGLYFVAIPGHERPRAVIIVR